MWIEKVIVIVCVTVTSGYCDHRENFNGLNHLENSLNECLRFDGSSACFSEKAARVIESSMNSDVQLFEGMTFLRNNRTINHRQARLLGLDRLRQSIKTFLQTHVISLELGGARKLGRDGGLEGFGGDSGYSKKAIKKEKKYMQYAFMVLLGIFGLTGPLVMKVLGLMAAQALLAAKAALIIVGSVALKKLFEKDHNEPAIKVHTINHDEDEHDRMSKFGITGYGYEGQYQNNPYNGYYDSSYNRGMNIHKER